MLTRVQFMGTYKVKPTSPQAPSPPAFVQASLPQLWQVPCFLAGLLALVGIWATRPLWYDPEARQLQRDLADARRMLEEPNSRVNGVPALLEQALERMNRFPARMGEAHFLLGSAYLRLADQLHADKAVDTRRKARSELELAEKLGVPEADLMRLRYRLGKVWFQTGGDSQRIADYLSQSVEQAADDRSEGYGMLAQTYRVLNNVSAALQANEWQLQLPTRDENLLAPARLFRGELLLGLKNPKEHDAARKVLVHIGPSAPPGIFSRARSLLARSYQDDQDWSNAERLWKEIVKDPGTPVAERGRILYDLGLCYRNLKRPKDYPKDAADAWTRAIGAAGQEGQAAMLRLAELRLESGDRPAAIELYERALQNVSRPEDYQNPLVALTQARSLLESACRVCQEAGDYQDAYKLALLYTKLTGPGSAQLLLAQAAEGWAVAKLEQAHHEKNSDAAHRAEEEARTHFREAGSAYQAAAKAQHDQADWLWRAGESFWQGQDFHRAVAVWNQVVQLSLPAERRSEAWHHLGEAYDALQEGEAAAQAYRRSIEQSGEQPGPFAFRSRYRLAMVEARRRNFDEAEKILVHNLELMTETDREAHEQSLFALAALLFRRGEYSLAAWRWEKALAQYPANPEALTAHFRLGECYRHLAEADFQQFRPSDPFADERIRSHRGQNIRWLEQAAAHYQKVVDDLEARQQAATWKASDAALLANALFARADCRFNLGTYLGRYDEAIALYDDLAKRYVHQVEGLIAVKELWRCYFVSEPPDREKAEATLKRARQHLEPMEDSAFQGLPESQSRAAWQRWIQEAEEQLSKLRM